MKLQKMTLGLAMLALSFNVFAAIKPPPLRQPLKNDSFAIKKPISFSWDKVSGALKYRLIISKDDKFTRYEANKSKCAVNTAKACFSTVVQSAKFTLPATNPLLQAKSTFYWQVQAIGSGSQSRLFQGTSSYNKDAGEIRPFSVSELLAIPKVKAISSDSQSIAAGESLAFFVTLTTELLDGYVVNVDYGDGAKKMGGSGTDYSYTATPKIVGEEQSFTISVMDSTGEEVDSLSDVFTVTESSGEPVVIPEPVKPEPIKIEPIKIEPVKTVTVPNVSTINVSPSSVIQGNSLTFSTTLSGTIPAGYSVKVDYGNGLFSMTGSGKNYSLNVAPTVSAAYSIGVYDSKNTLKSNSQTGNFSVTAPNEKPTLSLISGGIAATIGTPYVTQLSANDSNLSLIFMDWGDGASESKNATSGATVSFSHTYNSEAAFIWNATAYDSQDATSPAISKSVTVSKPTVKADTKPTGTSGYTKIANNGSALSDDAKIGSGSTDWACTKDNKTGLIWEVKTTDGGLRDWKNYYSWYKPEGDNGGFAGYQNGNGHPEWCKGSNCDTYAFTNAVNAQGLCGANNWRMPKAEELAQLVLCSDGKYSTYTGSGVTNLSYCTNSSLVTSPTINTAYFPNAQGDSFWSSSPRAGYSDYAWIVYFDDGSSNGDFKSDFDHNVRLVR